jgi:hypothetical protein
MTFFDWLRLALSALLLVLSVMVCIVAFTGLLRVLWGK